VDTVASEFVGADIPSGLESTLNICILPKFLIDKIAILKALSFYVQAKGVRWRIRRLNIYQIPRRFF
jgi:hypothetical protein